jgi:hypothetical protein
MRFVAAIMACLVLLVSADKTQARDTGLVTVRSNYSVAETIKRFEHAIELRSDND